MRLQTAKTTEVEIMDLMDWKQIETGAQNQINDAKIQEAIGRILYEKAVENIKRLGGKTNEQENEEARAKHKPKV